VHVRPFVTGVHSDDVDATLEYTGVPPFTAIPIDALDGET
jgi:hypothetical protein